MTAPPSEAQSVLSRLAVDVDADLGAHLYMDRGDGVLELVASSGTAVAPSGARQSRLRSRLRRWTGRSHPGSLGAAARLAMPHERDGFLQLERSRGEPFSDADLAIARVQARRLVPTVTTRLGPRPIAWSAQLDAVQHEQFLITVLVVDGRRVSRVRVEPVPPVQSGPPVPPLPPGSGNPVAEVDHGVAE